MQVAGFFCVSRDREARRPSADEIAPVSPTWPPRLGVERRLVDDDRRPRRRPRRASTALAARARCARTSPSARLGRRSRGTRSRRPPRAARTRRARSPPRRSRPRRARARVALLAIAASNPATSTARPCVAQRCPASGRAGSRGVVQPEGDARRRASGRRPSRAVSSSSSCRPRLERLPEALSSSRSVSAISGWARTSSG